MSYLKRLGAPKVSRFWEVLALLWWSSAYDFSDGFKYFLYVIAAMALMQWLWEARRRDTPACKKETNSIG